MSEDYECTEQTHHYDDFNYNKYADPIDCSPPFLILYSVFLSLPLRILILCDQLNNKQHDYIAHDDICEGWKVAKHRIQLVSVV